MTLQLIALHAKCFSSYPTDVLVPLAWREGLWAHNHAVPDKGTLSWAPAGSVLGSDCCILVNWFLSVSLFINLSKGIQFVRTIMPGHMPLYRFFVFEFYKHSCHLGGDRKRSVAKNHLAHHATHQARKHKTTQILRGVWEAFKSKSLSSRTIASAFAALQIFWSNQGTTSILICHLHR